MSVNSRQEAKAFADKFRDLAKELDGSPQSLARVVGCCSQGFLLMANALDPGEEPQPIGSNKETGNVMASDTFPEAGPGNTTAAPEAPPQG